MKNGEIQKFQTLIWDFYKKNKRTFPWRETRDPYNILVSEIMLQQTQADRVVRYYERWIDRFPDFPSLAKATFSEIYEYWQGLGYNRRGLALQKLAQEVIENHQGKLPEDLEALPGIGPYTAKAVAIFSFNAPVACLETNIRRVFIHHFFHDKQGISDPEILAIATEALPPKKSRQWHWALMDYGAYLKSQIPNPNRRHKNYAIQSKFEGSLRQIRGAVLKILSAQASSFTELKKVIKRESGDIKKVLTALETEGFISYDAKKKTYHLS